MPRELIDTGRDKRFVRRDDRGRFDDVVDVGRSLSQDRKRKAKRTVKAGEADRGDQAPRKRKSATGSARKSAAGGRKKAGSATTRATAKARSTKSGAKARPRAKAKPATKSRGRGRGR